VHEKKGWARVRAKVREERETFGLTDVTSVFFVSVAAKGFSDPVSLLFATLAASSISVAAKELTGTDGWQENICLGCEDFEGVRRTTRRIFETKWSFKFTRHGSTKE
jgi:hypothetical protein